MSDGPTLAAIARHAGVSQATACRALNPAYWDKVSSATRALVVDAAEKLGYQRCRAVPQRRDPVIVLPATPAAYVTLSRGQLDASLRGATLRRDRRSARTAAVRRNQNARANGGVPDWDVYALVPVPRWDGRPGTIETETHTDAR